MKTRTHRAALSVAMLAGMLHLAAPAHAEETPITSTWRVQEINYAYIGYTTAYDCNAAAAKIKAILRELGAHQNTKVTANGCGFNRPSRNFFVTITAATPVPVSDAQPSPADQSKQELLKKLGAKSDFSTEEFPAQWKSVDLAKHRRLDLRPGDCELMEGLQDRVLPKLGIKSDQRVNCSPNQLGISTPPLTVSALMPLAG